MPTVTGPDTAGMAIATHGFRMMLLIGSAVALLAGGAAVNAEPAPSDLPAFPGAQGAGATTPGGRGGTVYKVTRLDDYGEDEQPIPGTLRHAVEQDHPRSVVFGVGGTLRLERPLIVKHPNLTVAGNTAPFPGITITAYPTMVRADHVVLRYLRFRLDVDVMRERFRQGLDSGWDCIDAANCEYVIFDHLSASHSVDETISFSGEVDHVTLSHSIAAYSLRSVFHDYYFERGPDHPYTQTHNLGGLMAYLGKPDRHATASSIYNIWAHHDRRMPGLSAGRNDPRNLMSHIDIRNSVMYNWKSNAAGIETGDVERSRYHVNFVGNYLKPGPNTPEHRRDAGLKVMGHNRVYLEGNVHDDDAQAGRSTKQAKLLLDRGVKQGAWSRELDEPLPTPAVETILSPELEQLANVSVGASLPARDSVDARVITEINEGTGKHPFADLKVDESPQVPRLPTVRHVYAGHDDPFPVWWKLRHGLQAETTIDPHADADGDGYTNIEAYMHGLPLKGDPLDSTDARRNRNPLADPSRQRWTPAVDPSSLPDAWTGQDQGLTIHSRADGLVIIFIENPATPESKSAPGKSDASDGLTDSERAVVLAFPTPQTLSGVRLVENRAGDDADGDELSVVRVEGLRGWPDRWRVLAGADEPISTDAGPTVTIPEAKRAPYAAYRLVFPADRDESQPLPQPIMAAP